MDTAVPGLQGQAKSSMTGKCTQTGSLEQWDNRAEPSMVMMSLPRVAAPVAVWKPACGSKERVTWASCRRSAYRQDPVQISCRLWWGPNNITLAKEFSPFLIHAYKFTNIYKDELLLHAPILSVGSSQGKWFSWILAQKFQVCSETVSSYGCGAYLCSEVTLVRKGSGTLCPLAQQGGD